MPKRKNAKLPKAKDPKKGKTLDEDKDSENEEVTDMEDAVTGETEPVDSGKQEATPSGEQEPDEIVEAAKAGSSSVDYFASLVEAGTECYQWGKDVTLSKGGPKEAFDPDKQREETDAQRTTMETEAKLLIARLSKKGGKSTKGSA